MATNSIRLSRGISISEQTSLDARQEIDALANRYDIEAPYIGLIFYAKAEAQHYKVTGLADGYQYYSDLKMYPAPLQPTDEEWVDYEIIPNAVIGTYEILVDGSASESDFNEILSMMRDQGFTGSNTDLANLLLDLWNNKDNIVSREVEDLVSEEVVQL